MLRRFIPAAAALVLTAACATITAQTDPGEGGDKGLVLEDMARYSEPGPEHDLLDHLRGKWNQVLEIRSHPDDETQKTNLEMEFKWAMGGRYIVGSSSAYVNGRPYTGRQIFGYDRFRGEYAWIQFDNMSTMPLAGRGKYDAATKTLTIEGKYDDIFEGKRDVPFKIAWTFSDEGYTSQYWTTDSDTGKMFKMLHATARRPE